MRQPDMGRNEVATGQSPAHADQGGDEELDLLPIGMTRHADMAQADPQVRSRRALQRNRLVDDPPAALRSFQRLYQRVGQGENEVEEPDAPELEILREMEPEQRIVKRVGGAFKELDLAGYAQARVGVFHLRRAQAR